MSDLEVRRWRRYGRDRLYVRDQRSGTDLGWIDLQTWAVTVHDPARKNDIHAAIALYCQTHGIEPGSIQSAPPHTKSDVAAEAEAWLASRAAPQPRENYYVKIDWRDTALNKPGERAAEQAAAIRAEGRGRPFLARLRDVSAEERAWRIGSQGEQLVANDLAKLPAGWATLHAVEVGSRGSDVDHVVIGPGGVFTINAKHHPNAKVWVGGNSIFVNGHRQPYVRNSRHEAKRASRLLSVAAGFHVPVQGVIAFVNTSRMTVKNQPDDVRVLSRVHLAGWLTGQRARLSDDGVDHILRVARKSTTWTR